MLPVIIVVGFSRAESLKRLLVSLENAKYPSEDIKLIISLDGGSSLDVVEIANEFIFSHGEKIVVLRKVNLGLRKHIIWCGDQTEVYDSVIVLEDDLYVDPWFYFYSIHSIENSESLDLIGGIALYSPRFNEQTRLPFEPFHNGLSFFLFQQACSWGQIWTQKQWGKFKKWYVENSSIRPRLEIPTTIFNWPESSWKKYFTIYLIENNIYFLYPYISYTTNFADQGGTHVKNGSSLYQVAMHSNERECDHFKFPSSLDQSMYYDAFMEPIISIGHLTKNTQNIYGHVEIDIYGAKPLDLLKKYDLIITTKSCKKYVGESNITFKPVELNLLNILNRTQVISNSGLKLYLVTPDQLMSSKLPYAKLVSYYSNFPVLSKKSIVSISWYYVKNIFSHII